MDIEKQIKKVNDYFVKKLIDGDYEVYDSDSTTVKIQIDFQYNFELWIANGPESFECYSSSFFSGMSSFMHLSFSDKEKKELHRKFNIYNSKSQRERRVKELTKELNNLKQSL